MATSAAGSADELVGRRRPTTAELSSPNGDSLSKILENAEIFEQQLNCLVSEKHLHSVSKFMKSISWEKLAKSIGLNEDEIDTVKGENLEEKMLHMLQVWKSEHASKAIYRKLVEALIHLKMTSDAEEVCRLVRSEIVISELQASVITDAITTGIVLGRGAFGIVEEYLYNRCREECAGKRIFNALVEAGIPYIKSRHVEESKLMAKLKHTNIVKFIGVCYSQEATSHILLMERLIIDMHSLLLEKTYTIPLSLRMVFLIDVAQGLAYLHVQQPSIIHRYLSAQNVHLSLDLVAKITGLGNCRTVSSLEEEFSFPRLDPAYLAPECGTSSHTTSLDIFSFGHLALFTVTRKQIDLLLEATPDPDNPTHRIVRSEVERRRDYFTEQQLKDCGLKNEIKMCLAKDPCQRPTAEKLKKRLNVIVSKVRSDEAREQLKEQLKQIKEGKQSKASGVLESDAMNKTTVPGQDIKKAVLSNYIGRGSYGIVYEVKCNGSIYAAKDFCNDAIEKFGKECSTLSKLEHPNIVRYQGICRVDKLPNDLLMMERLDFCLRDYLKYRCDQKTKLSILMNVASGLEYLHQTSVIHRDLTVNNVLLAVTQELPVAKIADFGNSRVTHTGTTLTERPGTKDYMPPEAFTAPPITYTEKLDIFSFGHLALYTVIQQKPEVLPGHVPTGGGLYKVCIEVDRRKEWIDKLDDYPVVQKLIKECLDNTPEKRPSAEDLVKRITASVQNIPVSPSGDQVGTGLVQSFSNLSTNSDSEYTIFRRETIPDTN